MMSDSSAKMASSSQQGQGYSKRARYRLNTVVYRWNSPPIYHLCLSFLNLCSGAAVLPFALASICP